MSLEARNFNIFVFYHYASTCIAPAVELLLFTYCFTNLFQIVFIAKLAKLVITVCTDNEYKLLLILKCGDQKHSNGHHTFNIHNKLEDTFYEMNLSASGAASMMQFFD